ncbi:MAG: uroporphyrinogen decarboxylase [Acidimicrobiia bacterium]|nr:uroporphyrinogen decarboxylase [Acidimicrobiia bacterium]MYC46694.1 uroporphyrinogen decarboxylase [Acidimicrobiia bacterium]MYI19715.1 uroporphyrinogen decarboxylase [Acidimicrobiia bacterium]
MTGVAALADSRFLRACRGLPVDRTPVWFMRQAGRSLPEYHRARGDTTLLEAVARPELVTELTLQPVRRYGVDAAVLFSDIVVPLEAIGFGVDIVAGTGPVMERPFAGRADLARLRPPDGEDLAHVNEAVRLLVDELEVPLIGFAGAPFTLASYVIEGGPSRHHPRTKALMLGDPGLWDDLTERLADLAIASLGQQVAAGATAVQLFDSWAGCLSPDHYRRFAAPASRRVLAAVGELGVPAIHFGVGTGELLADMAVGADVVGVDWRVPLDAARARLGQSVAVQGNLDPAACLAPWEEVATEARAVLAANGRRPGHVFNLGHGVLPETDPAILERLVDLVHHEGLSAEP